MDLAVRGLEDALQRAGSGLKLDRQRFRLRVGRELRDLAAGLARAVEDLQLMVLLAGVSGGEEDLGPP